MAPERTRPPKGTVRVPPTTPIVVDRGVEALEQRMEDKSYGFGSDCIFLKTTKNFLGRK
jgi:hypothetical protein